MVDSSSLEVFKKQVELAVYGLVGMDVFVERRDLMILEVLSNITRKH